MEEKRFNDVPMPKKSGPKSRDGCMVGGTAVQQDCGGKSTRRRYACAVCGRASTSVYGARAPVYRRADVRLPVAAIKAATGLLFQGFFFEVFRVQFLGLY